MFQVFRQESSPHHYLVVCTGSTTGNWWPGSSIGNWCIKKTLAHVTVSRIESPSAATSCPASPSNSMNKKKGRLWWSYRHGDAWRGVYIDKWLEVSCETPKRCHGIPKGEVLSLLHRFLA